MSHLRRAGSNGRSFTISTKYRSGIVAAVIALSTMLAAAPFADAAWTKSGPIPGAFVGAIAYAGDGSILYAGGIGTVFRSTDNGNHWTASPLPAGFASSVVVSLATSPLDRKRVLASTWDVGPPTSFFSQYGPAGDAVFASGDGGVTWIAGSIPNQVSSNDSQYPYHVVWDPRTVATAYASSAGTNGTGAVYRTTDGGRTWSQVYSPRNLNQPFHPGAIAAAPTSPVSLYFAATDFSYATDGDGFIAQSTDGAASLSFVEPLNYIGFPGYGPVLTAFAVDRNPATVYTLATGYNDNTLQDIEYLQFLWTPNSGLNWVVRTSGLPKSVIGTALAVDPAIGEVLLPLCCAPHNELYVSKNQGKNWAKGGEIPAFAARLVARPGLAPRLPATLAGAGPGGVLVSANGGKSWFIRNGGLTQPNITDVVADPSTPNVLYVGSKSGVLRSTDGGRSFAAIDGGLGDREVAALALDAKAATHVLYAATASGVYRSENPAGAAPGWTEITPPATAGHLGAYAIATDRAAAGRLYVSTVLHFAPGQSFRSDDFGAHWTAIGFPPPGFRAPGATVMLADPRSPGTVYLAASIGIYKSANAGRTFTRLPAFIGARKMLFGQADEFNPRTLYLFASNPVTLAGRPTILRSTDGGNSWDSNANPAPGGGYLLDLAADPGSSRLYALVVLRKQIGPLTALSFALFQSPNRGFSWFDITGNLPALSPGLNGGFTLPAVTRAPALWATGNTLALTGPLAAGLYQQPLR